MTTLELRYNTPSWRLGVIEGQWRRTGLYTIEATYSPEELAYALACAGKTRAALRLLVDAKRQGRARRESLRLRGFA